MKLIKVIINKYKNILKEQIVKIESNITTLVRMNESGTTSFLQTVTKINYFNGGVNFKFDTTVGYQKGKHRVTDLIQQKIIADRHSRFFNKFTNNGKLTADIEDLFSKEECLKLSNVAFEKEYPEIKIIGLDSSLETILKQINKVIGKDRFNYYRPANKLNQFGVDKSHFSTPTLDSFENMFIEISKLF